MTVDDSRSTLRRWNEGRWRQKSRSLRNR